LRCSDAARDAICTCALEFVKILSATANEAAEGSGRKTIGVGHVVAALRKLGFGAYAEDVQRAAGEHAEHQQLLPSRKQKKKLTATEAAELARQQQAYFDEVRMKMEAQDAAAAAAAAGVGQK
jgi:hypothetical protein